MPYFAKKDPDKKNDDDIETTEPRDKTEADDKKNADEVVSDDDFDDLIKPELFTLNVPAILEIFFGLFILLYAIMLIGISLELGLDSDLGVRSMAQGIGFIILMLISFFVGYGIIMKKKYGALLGFGKGIFLVSYFTYSVLDYRRLMLEAEGRSNILFSDLYEASYYQTNMYSNILLLVFALMLTLLILRIIFSEGYFKTIFSKPEVIAEKK